METTGKPVPADSALAAPADRRNLRRFASVEVIGEMILLTAVAGFFIYIGLSARHWPFSAMLTPLIAVAIGTPFLIWRIVSVLRIGFAIRSDEASRQQIMDTGFRIVDDPKIEGQRFLRVFVALGVLYGGIWLLGFHITVPLWVFVYMRWFGKVPLIWAGLVALLFLGLMVGLYDRLLDALWHEPMLFKWLGINWFE